MPSWPCRPTREPFEICRSSTERDSRLLTQKGSLGSLFFAPRTERCCKQFSSTVFGRSVASSITQTQGLDGLTMTLSFALRISIHFFFASSACGVLPMPSSQRQQERADEFPQVAKHFPVPASGRSYPEKMQGDECNTCNDEKHGVECPRNECQFANKGSTELFRIRCSNVKHPQPVL